jgi:outer membrane protein assembly factor BamA
MWKEASKCILILYIGACGLLFAQSESRSDLVESTRTQKEANLTPDTPPKGEIRIESIEHSLPYRLLTGEVNGFGLGSGNIMPGAGLATGPQYRRTDLLGGRLTAVVQARAAINESYLGRLDLLMPSLLGGKAFLGFTTMHRNISEMPYYGAGPESRKTGRSNYRLEETNVELRPGVRIYKGLSATLIGSFLAVNVGPGHSTKYISTEKQFSPEVAPGIDHQTNFWRGGGLLEYNWLDNSSSPTSGGKYSAQYVRYLDQNLGRYSFLRLDLDAWQYVPLFNHTRVIALHGASSLTTTNSTQQVPFYLQPALGGPDTLRGYRVNRFYGNNSTMVTAEYRWDASPILQMVAFADGGKVFNNWEQWNFHNIQTDVGFGLRFRGRSARNVFSFETGFSHEGFQIWFRMNNAFQSRAQ